MIKACSSSEAIGPPFSLGRPCRVAGYASFTLTMLQRTKGNRVPVGSYLGLTRGNFSTARPCVNCGVPDFPGFWFSRSLIPQNSAAEAEDIVYGVNPNLAPCASATLASWPPPTATAPKKSQVFPKGVTCNQVDESRVIATFRVVSASLAERVCPAQGGKCRVAGLPSRTQIEH